jgi:signal peptidase I
MATDPLPPQQEQVIPPSHETTKQRESARAWPEHVQSLLSIIVIALFIIIFIVQAFRIPSGSMEDTLLVGDYLLVDKFTNAPAGHWSWILPYKPFHRGDIMVFKWPIHPEQHFVKRVIGLPGDRVRLVDGKVFVNGNRLSEPYAVRKLLNFDPFRDDFPNRRSSDPNINPKWSEDIAAFTRNNELVVPEDCYFVLGDNRDSSLDSRYWGFVPAENVVGRPLMIYFSLQPFTDEPGLSPGADDKIGRFADRLKRSPSMARWSRILHFVK